MTAALPIARQPVRTTCPYCGVGCGVMVQADGTAVAPVSGDRSHPANCGRLCVKGSALHETTGLATRLLKARVDGREVAVDDALDCVVERLQTTIARHGRDAVGMYLSGQLLTEDYYVANKLMKGFIGSPHVDTNSRLCMASAVAAYKRAFGEDLVPGCYEDLDLADLVVAVGWNGAWTHPVLWQRITDARAADPNKRLVVIDPRRTATAESADLHLAVAPGTDGWLLNGLLTDLVRRGAVDDEFVDAHTAGFDQALAVAAQAGDAAAVANRCGIPVEQVERFYDWFAATARTVTVFSQGVNQSSSGTDKANAIINCHLATGRVGRPGACPFSITGQPNAMGGREVGGLANQLAAHTDPDSAADRALVANYWRAPNMIAGGGYKAVELFEAVERGDIRFLWIVATNPLASLPDTERWRRALERCDTVVVSDCAAATDTTAVADILLPAASWGEKDGTVTNSERCISRQRPFAPAAGEASPDWQLFTSVANRLGYGAAFDYRCARDIFVEHAELTDHVSNGSRMFNLGGLARLTRTQYDQLEPVRWPVTTDTPAGTARLFGDGRFATVDGRARFVAVRARMPASISSARFPLVLNTGRLRDQWHTMTRTALSARLNRHSPEPTVSLHPATARHFGIERGDIAEVFNERGRLLLRAVTDPAVGEASVFVPMHFSRQFSDQATAGRLVAPVVDPVSGQPESKHAVVALRRYPTAWHALVVADADLSGLPGDYRMRSPLARGAVHWLAGSESFAAASESIRTLLPGGIEIEYSEDGDRDWRAAAFCDGRLAAVAICRCDSSLPAPWWLADRLGERLENADRAALLSGGARGEQEAGAVVCSCYQVGEYAINRAIAEGCGDTAALARRLACGSGCGSCIPELRRMLRDAAVAP